MNTKPAPQSADADVDALFKPIRIGAMEVPNRIAMAPMTRNFTSDGVVVPDTVDYYRRRAEGGAGLILTEGIAVNLDGTLDMLTPRLDCEAGYAIWREVVDAVHAAGSRIVAQLWHTGLMRGKQSGDADPAGRRIGPSQDFPLLGPDGQVQAIFAQGEAMTKDDIARTIRDCVQFSVKAQELGFDGVEIHGAHGYLFDQFFWTATNQRPDEYNGGQAERVRFAAETIAAIRAAVGEDFVIGLRFSQWKNPAEHYPVRMFDSPEDLRAFLAPLVDAGVDFFDCSTRRYWEPVFEGSDKCLAEWTQELGGKPAIAVGSVTVNLPLNTTDVGEEVAVVDNLAPLAKLVGEGRIGMVAVGRAFIANPDWGNRVREGGVAGLRVYDQAELARLY